MKRILILLSAITLTFNLTSQPIVDSNNIYLLALEKHLGYLKEFYQNRPDLIKIPDTYFIEKDWISTKNFPSEIRGQKIEVFSQGEIIESLKTSKSIEIIAVRPVQWKKGQMEIHVVGFVVSGTKRKLNYENQMNGSSFQIKPSSDCQGFEIERIKRE